MRIMVSGVANTGKSTFITDFLHNWPSYKSSGETYRAVVKEKSLKLNKSGNKESQELILNCLLDEAMKYRNTDNVIHDRGVLDNLVYTMWLSQNPDSGVDDEFVQKSLELNKQAMRFYDIIFYIPYDEKIAPVAEKATREVDASYNKSIDSFYKAMIARYHLGDKTLFPFDDGGCGAFIEVAGTRQIRLETAKLYVTPEGGAYGEKDSLLTGEEVQLVGSLMEKAKIDKALKKGKKR